ncbi:DUF397 domain-containing protein [Actinocorallia sp. API 0066]|uniref:DUF397 domain-containing protein n=1 Tax=Actinocorallia sp. API 0066 TaxID=2896846 RepID=UPI001E52895A|nr:DUF397 domain-containing protein [Actinocorallia sp. API 0066]MCD0449219.1 DUF397 domain-containing protein [Actinocorallia sp. API 0066]
MTPLAWRKSSYSDGSGDDCVEVSGLGSSRIGLRDSKHPTRGHLSVPTPAFRTLLTTVRATRPRP